MKSAKNFWEQHPKIIDKKNIANITLEEQKLKLATLAKSAKALNQEAKEALDFALVYVDTNPEYLDSAINSISKINPSLKKETKAYLIYHSNERFNKTYEFNNIIKIDAQIKKLGASNANYEFAKAKLSRNAKNQLSELATLMGDDANKTADLLAGNSHLTKEELVEFNNNIIAFYKKKSYQQTLKLILMELQYFSIQNICAI
jgi:hypothetical protein